MPGTAVVWPSLLVTVRPVWGVRLSLSAALLLAGLVSVTPTGGLMVAVLVTEPVAEGSIWIVKVKVTLAPTGRSTLVDRAPLPLRGLLALTPPPPLLVVNVQVAAVTPAGRGSDSAAPLAALGPALPTTMV